MEAADVEAAAPIRSDGSEEALSAAEEFVEIAQGKYTEEEIQMYV